MCWPRSRLDDLAAGRGTDLPRLRRHGHAEGLRRDGLVAQIERVPYVGALFIFRGRRGDLVKAIYFDGQGLVLFSKRLENGRFVWPQAKDGMLTLTAAQLSMLIEGIDWRMPAWTVRPEPEMHR